jgi:hypothetical protein
VALEPLAQSLSFPKPLSGSAKGTLTVHGPLTALRLAGHIDAGPIAYGVPDQNPFRVQRTVLDVTLGPVPNAPEITRLTVTEGLIKTAEEQIRLDRGSFVDFAGKKPAELRLAAQIRNLHLGLFTLFGGLDLAGRWQIKPAGFAIQGDLHTRGLFINDYELEEGHVAADYYDGLLRFDRPARAPALITGSVDVHRTPQLVFKDFFISGKDEQGLRLSGELGPARWDFRLLGTGLDLATLGNLAGFSYPMEGAADVDLRGTGDLQHPHIEGTLRLESGRVLGLAFRSGGADFLWQDARMTFTRLQLTDPGRYTLTGAGGFPLAPREKGGDKDRTIDFSLRLENSNLGLLQSFSDEIRRAKGELSGLVQIRGTAERPVLRGNLRVAGGEIQNAHYFRTLQNVQMVADFERDELIVKRFSGHSGNGDFAVTGKIAFSGFEPRYYDLTADVPGPRGIEIQVPELAIPESPLAKRFRFLTTVSRTNVRGRMTFKGPADAPVFSGEAFFSNGHFTFPPSRKNPPPGEFIEWVRRILWDVHLKFGDGAWFENELVEASLIGGLHLRGPSERLRVDGGMDINEGKISYLGIEFAIRQARFDMRSDDSGTPVVNTPWVRGIGESRVQAVDTLAGQSTSDPSARLDVNDTITLTIDYAPIDQIKPRLASASNPSLTQDKLLARVTQLDTEHLTPQERSYLYRQQMVRLLDTSLATPLARNILKRTGLVDTLRVSRVINPTEGPISDPTGSNPNGSQSISLLANTKYTFEKNVSSRLALGYGVRFEQTNTPELADKLDLINDVELSYRWFRNVYLRGTFDLPNANNPSFLPERKVTIEPRWRFGWWGNTNKGKGKSASTGSAPSR